MLEEIQDKGTYKFHFRDYKNLALPVLCTLRLVQPPGLF